MQRNYLKIVRFFDILLKVCMNHEWALNYLGEMKKRRIITAKLLIVAVENLLNFDEYKWVKRKKKYISFKF